MRVATDGYIDLRSTRVRTPGDHTHDQALEPLPEGESIAFLLSHSFRGHRRVVRSLSLQDRKRIRLALWADSVSERATLLDRVWRSITEAVATPKHASGPHLAQVIRYGDWAYPLYFDGEVTRVIPLAGTPFTQAAEQVASEFELDRMTA